jgi:hypothetical protein
MKLNADENPAFPKLAHTKSLGGEGRVRGGIIFFHNQFVLPPTRGCGRTTQPDFLF